MTSGYDFTGRFWLRVSQVAVKLSSPDWTGAGEYSSKLTHTTVSRRAQYFIMWTSPSDCLGVLRTRWPAFPEQEIQTKEQASETVTKMKATVFYNLISEETYYHFCRILLVTETNTVRYDRRIHKGVNPRRQNHWRPS